MLATITGRDALDCRRALRQAEWNMEIAAFILRDKFTNRSPAQFVQRHVCLDVTVEGVKELIDKTGCSVIRACECLATNRTMVMALCDAMENPFHG